MNDKLFAGMEWPTGEAVNALRAEVWTAAARMAQKRRRRRETLVFALALCAFALGLGTGLWLTLAGEAAMAKLSTGLKAAGVCAGITLLFSPLLAYFMEGREGNA